MTAARVQQSYTAGPRADEVGPPSPRVIAVASMFGLGLDESRTVEVVPPTDVPLRSGSVVFVTGPSGAGKSTLLRRLLEEAETALPDVPSLDFAGLPEPPDKPLIDAIPTPTLEDVLRLLSLSGLNDAFVMLRRPCELSDGQRYRFGLARLMAEVENQSSEAPELLETPAPPTALVVADEFGAALDRLTAKVVARNVRKWVDRSGVCAVLATTHDDLLEPLRPDVLIEQRLGGTLTLLER